MSDKYVLRTCRDVCVIRSTSCRSTIVDSTLRRLDVLPEPVDSESPQERLIVQKVEIGSELRGDMPFAAHPTSRAIPQTLSNTRHHPRALVPDPPVRELSRSS